MGLCFEERNCVKIESISSHGLECPDTELAKQYIKVPFTQDILGSHQKIFDLGCHTSLQHDRKPGSANLTEQREILHIARSDLQTIRVFTNQLEIFGIHDLRDDR